MKSSTTNNESTTDHMPPLDSAETAISQLPMTPVPSLDDQTTTNLHATKSSSAEDIDDESKSDKDKYRNNVCNMTIHQSKFSTSIDDFVSRISYKPEFMKMDSTYNKTS